MFLREYRQRARDYYRAQFTTPEGVDRVWITMIIVTMTLDIAIFVPLIASLK